MRLMVGMCAGEMGRRPEEFRIVSVTRTALIVKIKTESVVVNVDVDDQLRYASVRSPILILLVLIGGLLLLMRGWWSRTPWALL